MTDHEKIMSKARAATGYSEFAKLDFVSLENLLKGKVDAIQPCADAFSSNMMGIANLIYHVPIILAIFEESCSINAQVNLDLLGKIRVSEKEIMSIGRPKFDERHKELYAERRKGVLTMSNQEMRRGF